MSNKGTNAVLTKGRLYTAITLIVLLFAYFGVYVPMVHSNEIAKMEQELEEKETIIQSKEKEVKLIKIEKEKTEEIMSEKLNKSHIEKVNILQEKIKLEEEAKKTEQQLKNQKVELEKKVKTLESKNKELQDKVSAKEREQVRVASIQHQEKNNSITRGGNYVNSETVRFKATAYTSTCNGCTGKTSTGLDIRSRHLNIIAVDPKVIPLGTKVELIQGGKSLGYYTAADTGGRVKGYKIDVLMPDTKSAYRFGVQTLDVRILSKPN